MNNLTMMVPAIAVMIASQASAQEALHYTCPMHPSVKAATQGQCPICGMNLTPVHAHGVVVDDAQREKIGVEIATVVARPMTRTVRAYGRVTYDESRLYDVAPRVHGWIVDLVAKVSGQRVRRGQVIAMLYSPEVYAAQQQMLDVLRRNGDARTVATFERKLTLMGVARRDIAALKSKRVLREAFPLRAPVDGYVVEKNIVEGTHAEAGQRLFRVAALDRVWVEADLFERDAPAAALGRIATVTAPNAEAGLPGVIEQVLPLVDAKTRAIRARVAVDNTVGLLRPGMYADVRIEVPLGSVRQVPIGAVVYAGDRRLVFVDAGHGRLVPRRVDVGHRADGFVEIRSGLEVGDRVVASGNFLIAAESRIEGGDE